MDVDQHENFPVASVLLPKALRAPIGIIYQVVRTAGDIADAGDMSASQRHARLADFRAGLDAVAARRAAPVHPPELKTFDWCVVASRTVLMGLARRVGAPARSIEGNL